MRHLRIILCSWKNCLIREMSFRGHFVLTVFSEVLWIGMMLVFLNVIFSRTPDVRGWTAYQYLFLMGTHLIVTGLSETFFYGNCKRFSELVRTGDLDFVLLKPASTQLLVSFDRIDFSALANVAVGGALCVYAIIKLNISVSVAQLAGYAVLVATGVVILYSLIFMFSICSVILIRQTGLEHLWFYTVSLARYPNEIYRKFLGGAFFFVLAFMIPVLLVTNIPARTVVRAVEPAWAGYMVFSAVALLLISRIALQKALKWYRSASS